MIELGGRISQGSVGSVRRAFTLIEMLLVIALIGIFSTIFVVNFATLLSESESQAVESAFWSAAREARLRALLERQPQWLRFEKDEAVFVVEEAGGGKPLKFDIDRKSWDPGTELEVVLEKKVPPNKFTLRQGELVDVREIAAAQFFPDGTCLPFQLSMTINGAESDIVIDPWTGARLLEDDEDDS
jgi:general secretion pathway protein H